MQLSPDRLSNLPKVTQRESMVCLLFGHAASLLQRSDSSCGAWAVHRVSLVARGTWDLPGPGIEPASPALEGGFFITGPPGKSPLPH